MKLHKNNVGLALGLFFAVWHFVWAILVAVGLAKPMMDWVFSLHHLEFTYAVAPFNLLVAVGLIIFTFVAGYVFGWVFAYLWNRFAR